MGMQRVTLIIHDLGYCGCGANALSQALANLQGVMRAFVSPDTEAAYVEYDSSIVSAEDLVRAVNRAGFSADRPMPR